ncbi:MAG TPA: protein-glutamate O-methyltransferase CheR [Cytophagaceae bacterium]
MDIGDDDIDHLLLKIKDQYGYDFTNYARASLLRRIIRFIRIHNLPDITELEKAVLNDENFFEVFVQELTVTVTEMFRDPSFYKAIREKVIPALGTYPHLRIWDAGCSTGEEVYSLSILLKEEELYDRSIIYATDINQKVLMQAKEGIYDLSQMQEYTTNYINAGGKRAFSDYYYAKYKRAIFDASLRKNVIFSAHNLATDSSFNEFNLIVCRNVLIYFNKELQRRVIELFLDSLTMFGYLALGAKETLALTGLANHFETVDKNEKIYRRIK